MNLGIPQRTNCAKLERACFGLLIVSHLLFGASENLAQEATPKENRIHVEIDGLHSNKGVVQCALFSSPKDFPKKSEQAVARAKGEIANGRAACEFEGVAAGTYAVSVFHDENSNGKLDTNFLGMPREGVGASNNAKGHMGPPKFDAASFGYRGERLNLIIKIQYL